MFEKGVADDDALSHSPTTEARTAAEARPPALYEPLLVGRPNIGSRARYFELLNGMLDRRWLSNHGALVQEFEARIADYLGVKHCAVFCNGTIALEVAVRALELTGEVIVPSYTFAATVHALQWLGLTPVFADVDPITHCLDPRSVRAAITSRTRGIMAVHLWGNAAPILELETIAQEYGLELLFDAAHAFGTSAGGRMVGNFGRCEIFSFHATKFLNSLEGGAIATNDDLLAERVRAMRSFGMSGPDNVVSMVGTNGKMVEACAAMGLVNLDSLDEFIAANRGNYLAYEAGLTGVRGIRLLGFPAGERNNYQYVVVEVRPESGTTRDQLCAVLHEHNVFARKYFSPGCHRMKPYAELFPEADSRLPVTNRLSSQVMVLPTGTSVSDAKVELICNIVREHVEGCTARPSQALDH